MRIAIFSNTYWPTVNGVAISIANLRQGLRARGCEVFVFAPGAPGHDCSLDEPGIVRFPALPAPVEADYQLAVPHAPAVLRVLRRVDFDLVHTHHPMWVGSWGQWYARLTGRPLVTTIHTQYEIYSKFVPLPDMLVDAYLRHQVKAFCNRCDRVTTPAASARERLLAGGVTTPIEVVFNPTDLTACLAASGEAIRAQLGCESPGDQLLGYVGRLAPEKNLGVLLEAGSRVLQRLPRARLLLIGDGPQRAKLEEQARSLPGGDRIIFVGKIPHRDIPGYQAALDLFITGSTMEVQPLSFAEAMATATPLVTFDVAGNNDMIEHEETGLLVPVEAGAEGLAEAALRLLTDREMLARLSQTARERSRRYDLPSVTDKMLAVYEQTIAATAGRPRRRIPGLF